MKRFTNSLSLVMVAVLLSLFSPALTRGNDFAGIAAGDFGNIGDIVIIDDVIILPPPPSDGRRINGRITQCESGAEGYTIEVYAHVKVGQLDVLTAKTQKLDQPKIPLPGDDDVIIDDNPPPPPEVVCRERNQVQRIGTAVTGPDGTYTAFLPDAIAPSSACSFEETGTMFVRVLEPASGDVIHTSDDMQLLFLNSFDTELECSAIAGVMREVALEVPTTPGDGSAIRGTVKLGSRAARNTTVHLFASRPDIVSLPSFVVVAAGAFEASFDVEVHSALSTRVEVFAKSSGQVLSTPLNVSPALYRLGDTNADGGRDISDGIAVLSYLFVGNSPIVSGFSDFNLDGDIDISDGLSILQFLFADGDGPPPCEDAPVVTGHFPDFATDGDEISIAGEFPARAYRVVIRGFKYTREPLFDENGVIPLTFEREQIYCGCDDVSPLRLEEIGDMMVVRVPLDAPSGEYEFTFHELTEDAPSCSGGVCPEVACQSSPVVVYVRPSHVTTRVTEMEVIGNGEDDFVPELSFTFSSSYGVPTQREDGSFRFPIEFGGAWPGGFEGSAHLTVPDGEVVEPDLPIFIGNEARMDPFECAEECAGSNDPNCIEKCLDQESTHSDVFEAAFSGIEADTERWWSDLIDIPATAALCYAANKAGAADPDCKQSASIAQSLESAVKSALDEDDDFMGSHLVTGARDASSLGWGIGSTGGPFELSGREEHVGPINITTETARMGSPRVIGYNVRVKEMRLIEGYEECSSNGTDVNELFMEARAQLFRSDRALRTTSRFSDNTGRWIVAEGSDVDLRGGFDVQPESVSSNGFGEDSPVLFVEMNVWEQDDSDEQKDLVGLYSRTIPLARFVSGDVTDAAVSDTVLPGGRLARQIVREITVDTHGWWGSDCEDCRGFFGGACNGPHYDRDGDGVRETLDFDKGRVRFTYEVSMTVLKYPEM